MGMPSAMAARGGETPGEAEAARLRRRALGGGGAAANPFLDESFRKAFAETHRHGFTPLNASALAARDVPLTVTAKSGAAAAAGTSTKTTSSVADAIDWRDEGVISDVKYQGSCGTCWAFVTTGLIEARYALDYGTLISLSEQQVMDCSRNSINQACSGGNQLTAIAGWSGNFYTEEEFPYILSSSGQSSRADAAESDDFCSETYTRQGVFALNESASIMSVSPRTEDALLEALQIGPVSVASAGYNNAFLTYTGGVLDDEACDSDDVVDHALLIVGYGTTDDGVDYYIAKNSWGPAWGEDGYVRLARNVRSDSRPYGACNILYQADYLEPYAVTCGLAYNAPCSTYANEEFCTVETGCQSSKYFAANYAFDASSIDSSGSSSSDKDGIYIGVSVSLGLLIIIGVVLFLRKMRREDREDRLEASKLAAFKDVFRRSISSASTMGSKRSGGLTSAQGYLDAAEREDEEAAQRRDRYGHKLSEFRRRLQAAQGRRLGAVASQDDLLLLYLEEHRGNLDAAVLDFIDRES